MRSTRRPTGYVQSARRAYTWATSSPLFFARMAADCNASRGSSGATGIGQLCPQAFGIIWKHAIHLVRVANAY